MFKLKDANFCWLDTHDESYTFPSKTQVLFLAQKKGVANYTITPVGHSTVYNSQLQMILIAYNYDDWMSFIGDFTKLGLSLLSILWVALPSATNSATPLPSLALIVTIY